MTKRSQWCEFDKETRKIIKKRDKEMCIYCGRKGALQIAHIFLSRAFGGRGCKENGVLLCINCHQILDNPIGEKQKNVKESIEDYCKRYLIEKEKIIFNNDFINSLKFDKKAYLEKISEAITIKQAKVPKIEEKVQKRYKYTQKCKSCCMLVKNKNKSIMPVYYCKVKKNVVSKNNIACEKFKEKKMNNKGITLVEMLLIIIIIAIIIKILWRI